MIFVGFSSNKNLQNSDKYNNNRQQCRSFINSDVWQFRSNIENDRQYWKFRGINLFLSCVKTQTHTHFGGGTISLSVHWCLITVKDINSILLSSCYLLIYQCYLILTKELIPSPTFVKLIRTGRLHNKKSQITKLR